MKITNKILQRDLIHIAMKNKYTLTSHKFYYYLFQYVINDNIQNKAHFLIYLLQKYIARKIYADLDAQIMDDSEAIKKLDNMNIPNKGFNGLIVVKVALKKKLNIYCKIWEDDVKKVKKLLDYFIKGEYELGIVDPYINEFEKLEN